MRFSVMTADEVETFYDGMFTIEDNGVLKIIPEAQDEPMTRLSPGFWRQINEPRPDGPLVY